MPVASHAAKALAKTIQSIERRGLAMTAAASRPRGPREGEDMMMA